MKAFVAVLLVAAVSGQFATSGVDKSIVDYLRTRNVYPYNVGTTYGDRSVLPVSAYGKYIQQAFAGLVGNDYDSAATGYFPYGQQYNVPSDVYSATAFPPTSYYTLSQLYASPIFQQYLATPFFRMYVAVPAFQRYLATPYFQQYWTQPMFVQFFTQPALFYKYIYPVVAQFQNFGTFEQTITVPEVYRQFVPEYVYNYINKFNSGVDATFTGRRSFYPTTYTKPEFYGQQYLNKMFSGYNWEKPTTTGFGYNWEKPATTGYNTYPFNYNYNMENMNVNDIETIRKVMFPHTFEKSATYPRNNWYNQGNTFYGQNFNAAKKTLAFPTWENNKYAQYYNNAEEVMPAYAPQYALDKIFKDLVQGKVDVNEYKTGPVVQDTFKNVVDPITGEMKIVEEKIVKPVENTMEGELKDALRKVMLKKEIFNKV